MYKHIKYRCTKNKDEDVLATELIKLKFMQVDGKFDYLLSMQIRTMTTKRIDELLKSKQNIENQIKLLEKLTNIELWKNELNELSKAL